MLKYNWIFRLHSFFSMSVTDGDGGVLADTETDTATNVDQETPEDAVLDAIGLADEGGEDKGESVQEVEAPAADVAQEGAEAAGDTDKQEVAEASKEGLTDADLAPLDSRNPKTNERFQKVTEGYKQEKAQREALQAEVSRYQQSFESLRTLGYTDEGAAHDLVNFSEYRKAIYSGDEKTFSNIIGDQIRQFESLYGKKISISASALDNHPDLREKVDALELDESTALELARSRELQSRINREAQSRSTHQQTEDTVAQELNGAVAAVENMQANWQKSDPDFKAILPHLQPMMEEIGRTYAPALWPKILDLQYKSLKKALAETQVTGRPGNMPLRGHGHQGTKLAPSTPQEAVLQSLGLDE